MFDVRHNLLNDPFDLSGAERWQRHGEAPCCFGVGDRIDIPARSERIERRP